MVAVILGKRKALVTTQRSPLRLAGMGVPSLTVARGVSAAASRHSRPALFQPQGKVRTRPGPSGGGLSVAAPYKMHGGRQHHSIPARVERVHKEEIREGRTAAVSLRFRLNKAPVARTDLFRPSGCVDPWSTASSPTRIIAGNHRWVLTWSAAACDLGPRMCPSKRSPSPSNDRPLPF